MAWRVRSSDGRRVQCAVLGAPQSGTNLDPIWIQSGSRRALDHKISTGTSVIEDPVIEDGCLSIRATCPLVAGRARHARSSNPHTSTTATSNSIELKGAAPAPAAAASRSRSRSRSTDTEIDEADGADGADAAGRVIGCSGAPGEQRRAVPGLGGGAAAGAVTELARSASRYAAVDAGPMLADLMSLLAAVLGVAMGAVVSADPTLATAPW